MLYNIVTYFIFISILIMKKGNIMKENIKEINLDIHNNYNDLPYKSHVHLYTAPQRIAAVAALYDLETPPLENARILELGCSFGANSIPTAILDWQHFSGQFFRGVIA